MPQVGVDVTTDLALLFVLIGAVLALLVWGRWRYDLVAFAALIAAVLSGLVPAEAAFSGFGHEATIIVALVLVISRGLVNSGAIQLVTRRVTDAARPLASHIAIMGGVGAVMSAFMNNVAALALLMPSDIQTAKKAGRPPGLSLMPLSFATILGGLATLIGTPPNIVIASFREDALGEPFAMFDFAPVGLACAVAGLAFIALIGWRLIPQLNGTADPAAQLAQLDEFIAELTVPEDSEVVGRRIGELDEKAEKADVAVIALVRSGRGLFGAARDERIRPGDGLLVEASPEALEEFKNELELAYESRERRKIDPAGEGLSFMQVVVPETALIVGRSALSLQLLRRRGVTLLGISRRGRRITERVRREAVQAGDILLLLGPSERLPDVATWLGCLPLEGGSMTVEQREKAPLAGGIFGIAVLAASLGLADLPAALGAVVVLYVLTAVVPLREIYDYVEWPVIVLLGSLIPLGVALEETGGTALLSAAVLDWTESLPLWTVLTVLMALKMALSAVLNNVATALILAPIAIDMAEGLQVNPDPFLMAVAVAASCAFLTPIGHKNNTLILGPGGYAFGDYWRMGLPLEIIIIAVAVPAILIFWPF